MDLGPEDPGLPGYTKEGAEAARINAKVGIERLDPVAAIDRWMTGFADRGFFGRNGRGRRAGWRCFLAIRGIFAGFAGLVGPPGRCNRSRRRCNRRLNRGVGIGFTRTKGIITTMAGRLTPQMKSRPRMSPA